MPHTAALPIVRWPGGEQATLPRGGDSAADTVELDVVEDHHGVSGQVRMPAGGVVQDGVEVVQPVDEQQPDRALPGGGGLSGGRFDRLDDLADAGYGQVGQKQAPGVGRWPVRMLAADQLPLVRVDGHKAAVASGL